MNVTTEYRKVELDEAPTPNSELTTIKRLASLLDSAIRIPGTKYRVGFDGILGLIPGFGDALGAGASALIVYLAAKAGAPAATLFRMVINIILDSIVGVVPVLGDVFDFTFKANTRNVLLLDKVLSESGLVKRSNREISRLFGYLAVALAIILPIGIVAIIIAFIRFIAEL